MFQGNHIKNQALFSSKDKSKKLKCRLLQFLFGALRVNVIIDQHKLHIKNHRSVTAIYMYL